MKVINGILGMIGALCLIVSLLALSVQTPATGLWFYRYEFEKNGTYDDLRLEKDETDDLARNIINYLKGTDETLTVGGVSVSWLYYTQREITHMEDVKTLFDWGFLIRNIAVIGFLSTLAIIIADQVINKKGRKPLRFLMGAYRNACIFILALLGIVGVYIAIDFRRGFTVFHELLFKNDLWLLDSRDLLIRLLPNAFFQDIAVFIAVMFAGLLVITVVAATVIRRRLRKP